MKFNNKELADLSLGEATIEGRLHYRKLHGGYSQSGKFNYCIFFHNLVTRSGHKITIFIYSTISSWNS